MGLADNTTTIMMVLLFARIAQMAVKIVRPAVQLTAMCLGCAVASVAILVPLVYEGSKLVSPQRDLGKFIPLNITPTVIFGTALFMCIVYIMLATWVFVTSVVVPILSQGPIMLVPKGKERVYDLRDRKPSLAA